MNLPVDAALDEGPRPLKGATTLLFFFFIPFIILASLALPPSSSSDPGSHSGPSSPLPTTVRAFLFVARRIQRFLPSSTRVELYLPTLLGALSS